tara:strand:- start:1357 stop:2634 length:1278 start_codon:yes stop_codon:yes gene_type:complete
MDTSPTLVTPILGTPASGTLTNCTFPTLNQNTTGTAANVSGTVLIANGGTSSVNAPDALTALGAYPSANPSGYTSNTGTVTGVTGTAPVFSSGGTTPVISMAAASPSDNGYMTAAYATKLNGIATGATANTGTVTSVSTSGNVSGITLTGSVTTSGTLTLGGAIGTLNQNTTGSSGSCTGNAATATTATNQSGGTVSATTISASGAFTGASGVFQQGALPYSLLIGADNTATTLTDATLKASRIVMPHYTNAEEGVALINASSQATINVVSIGGGSSSLNTATEVDLYAAANNTTTSGTLVAKVSSTGLAVTGAITATGNITAYFSDDRLKTKLGNIENALDKVCSLDGFYYEANETAQKLGYKAVREVGVSAQSVEKVLPELIQPAPIDPQYKTLDYARLVPLLIEAIKEQQGQINELKSRLGK